MRPEHLYPSLSAFSIVPCSRSRMSETVANDRNERFESTHAEASVPRVHRLHLFAGELAAQVGDNVGRVEVRDVRRPTRTDTVRAVDENHRQNRDVPALSSCQPRRQAVGKEARMDAPVRLDALPIVVEIGEDVVVIGVEHAPRDLSHVREDVTRARRIFPALESRTKLAVRVEDVQVVRADKVLREADDRALKRDVAVVVRRVLRDVTGELADLQEERLSVCALGGREGTRRATRLDFVLQLALEATEEDLALTGLEAVDYGRDRTNVVGH